MPSVMGLDQIAFLLGFNSHLIQLYSHHSSWVMNVVLDCASSNLSMQAVVLSVGIQKNPGTHAAKNIQWGHRRSQSQAGSHYHSKIGIRLIL